MERKPEYSIRNLQPLFSSCCFGAPYLLLIVLSFSLVLLTLLLLSCHVPPTDTIAVLLPPLALSSLLAGSLLSYAPLAGIPVFMNLVAFIFSLAILAGPLTADHSCKAWKKKWDIFSAMRNQFS